MKLNVKVKGDRELVLKLRAMADEAAGEALARAATAGALLVENAAKEKAPFKTGSLRRSIHTEVTEQRRDYAEVTVGTDLVYAAQVEFGGTIVPKKGKFLVFEVDGETVFARSVTQVARPYLRPAFDEKKDAAEKEVGRALRMLVERAGE